MNTSEEKPNKQSEEALKDYPKPSGYSELNFAGLKFYYRSEEVDYSDMDKKNAYRFEKYGFVYDHDISDSLMVYKSKEGEKALVIYIAVPTFDEGDREWDSYKKLYLLPDTGKITAFICRGGYKLAKVMVYEDVWWANAKTETLLKSTELFDCV